MLNFNWHEGLLHDSTHTKAMFHIIKDVAKNAKYKKYSSKGPSDLKQNGTKKSSTNHFLKVQSSSTANEKLLYTAFKT